MRSIYLLPVVLLACGDNKSPTQRPDAGPRPDGGADPDAVVSACNFTEAADATNDTLFGDGDGEATALSFTTSSITICGELDTGHYLDAEDAVDIDSFVINVPAQTSGIVYLVAPGGDAYESIAVEISGLTTTTAVSEVGVLASSFATTSARLVPGDYLITVSSYNPAATTTALPYQIIVDVDDPVRCAESTATANDTESTDGATASGNDVYEIRFSGTTPRQFTALGTDNPEPTGITVEPSASYRISGISSNPVTAPVSWMDAYQDRDTYVITTGATTNTLTVRLNWPGTTADLDFYVFPMNELNEIATGWYNRAMEDELTTLAVTPNTTYWLLVGADDASTGFPVNYDVTLCGGAYTVPTAQSATSPVRPRRHPVFYRTVRPLSPKSPR